MTRPSPKLQLRLRVLEAGEALGLAKVNFHSE
jgi:hypothetical protein